MLGNAVNCALNCRSRRAQGLARATLSTETPSTSASSSVRTLPLDQLLAYERKGHTCTRKLIPADALRVVKAEVDEQIAQDKLKALRQRVRVLCPKVDLKAVTTEAAAKKILKQQGTDELGFLQFFNLHKTCPSVKALVCGRAMAGTAAQILGAKKVRLYHDCAFLKDPGFGPTNWHSDLRMAPFDTNAYVTAWVPLRDIKGGEQDSGLQYAEGSHRDFALPFWHALEGRQLDDRGYAISDHGALQLGDVSWHHGWTLHCTAHQKPGSTPRTAISVAYFADGARLLPRRSDPSVRRSMLHDEDLESYQSWLPHQPDSGAAKHPDLPVVWP